MKNRTSSILYLSAIILLLAPGIVTAQHDNRTQQEKSTDKLTLNRNVGNQDAGEAAAIEILEKNLAALGGQDAFALIKSIEIHIERAILGRTIKVKRLDDVAGKRSFQRQDTDGNIIETGFDGKRAWQKAPFFRGYLEAFNLQAKALMRGGVNLPGANLYDYKSSGKKYARLPDEQIGGKTYAVIKSGYADEAGKETQVKYYLDPTTYLIKQIVSGNALTQTETLDDYRKVGGISVAFASTITNPQVTLTSKVTELKFNIPVTASVFNFQEAAVQPTSTSTGESRTDKLSPKTETGELSESIRLETFERVWKIVNDSFYDRTFNGVNWQAIQDRYLPVAKTTVTTDDFHRLLNRMVQELRLSHFKVVAPKNVMTLSSGAANLNNGTIGLSLQWIDNQLLVSAVKKDSPAALAKIRPGFALLKINDKTSEQLYAEYQKNNSGYQLREELARVRAVGEELAGKPDTKINLELTGAAAADSLRLELLRKAQAAGRQLEFESKKLAGNVGYIKFNLFFSNLLTEFQTALQEMKDTKALIIDLRGNPGGAGGLAPAMANLLCHMPGSLGSLKYRYDTQQYSYKGAGAEAYKGKVVLLTDAGTGSTAEVFAGGLQANNRAVVIGSPSAGAVMPSLIELLPTGGALQYVVSNFQTPKGIALEGKGVVPDVAVKSSRAALLAGRDTVLEESLRYIGK